MPANIVIVGALGRMGREIGAIVLNDPETRLVGCVEAPSHAAIGQDYGAVLGLVETGVRITADLKALSIDSAAIICFLPPAGVDALLDAMGSLHGGLVLGTTALGAATIGRVEALSARMPVVYSPNMSLGVNLLFHLTEQVAAKLGSEFDIEIVEAHHRHKQDAPSGTARRLGEIAAAARGLSYSHDVKHGRVGMVGERGDREIGMHAVRGGDIVGDHTVLFAGTGERIELRHMAHSRATFARGAVTAAKWIAGRGAGLYTMRDVLGLDAPADSRI